MPTVFIGVGHGGKDPGAIGSFNEKDLNLSIALACRDYLLDYGINVVMSRVADEDDTLQSEIDECNAVSPSFAIDIHNNAGGGDGVEIYHHFKGGLGKFFAENILAEVVALGQNSRGIKTRLNERGSDFYAFIRDTFCPATIIECAFVDNKEDIKIIDTESERVAMGHAIARGILRSFGVDISERKDTATMAKKIQEKCGLEDKTIKYLMEYKFCDDLIQKLWKAME